MKKIEISLTDEEVKLLTREEKYNNKLKVRKKAKVLLLRNEGYTESQIIQKTDLSSATIVSYVKAYQQDGINSIYTTKCKGQPSKLTPYADEIIEDLKKNPPSTKDEARQRISDKYGIKISKTAMGNFLKKKDFLTKKQEVFQQKQTKKSSKNS